MQGCTQCCLWQQSTLDRNYLHMVHDMDKPMLHYMDELDCEKLTNENTANTEALRWKDCEIATLANAKNNKIKKKKKKDF
jgi:hypothetical protein